MIMEWWFYVCSLFTSFNLSKWRIYCFLSDEFVCAYFLQGFEPLRIGSYYFNLFCISLALSYSCSTPNWRLLPCDTPLSSIRLKKKDSTCEFEKIKCFLLKGSIVSGMAQTLKHKRQWVVTIFQIK